MENKALYTEDLPNKPLGEAIFELKWALKTVESGKQRDPGFNILYGRLYDRLSKDYPFIEDLEAARVPEEMIPHIVRHRFRPSAEAWPLIQIGPGILTVNDTENYTWSRFESRVQGSLEALFSSYPFHLPNLTPISAQLMYINGVLFNTSRQSITDFLRDNLHISIDIESELFDRPDIARHPLDFHLDVSFPITKPKGTGILRFANGLKEQEPALVWQIVIHSNESSTPKDIEGLNVWLTEAHDVAEKWFFTLIRGKLRNTFEGQHGHSKS